MPGDYEKNSRDWFANPVQTNMDQLKSFIHRTAALAFVFICFLYLAWQGIKADIPELPRIDKFITYFETTWIARTFHTAEWNLYETEEPRTITCRVGTIIYGE